MIVTASVLAAAAATGAAAVLTVGQVATAPAVDSDAGWAGAPATSLSWDYTNGRPAAQSTSVKVVTDGTYLYVRFDAEQQEPVVSTQTTDDVGQGADDNVHVDLWPTGSNGFRYTFEANPRGTHYQGSTENSTYAPTWTSAGRIVSGGYVVTMRIPLSALRGDGRGSWSAQFSRRIQLGHQDLIWSHGAGQSVIGDVTFAGRLDGLGGVAKVARTKPRLGLYGLAEAGTRATSGSTSRMGADFSYPLTQTTSLVATFHPDYSNVETDQQTIAPTAFRRQYTEVRPFFAQGANFYDPRSCYGCPGAADLYTPAIPTPRRGYQLEGKQGQFTFGALDAVGEGRIDDAQSFGYSTPNRTFQWNYTRIASEQAPGAAQAAGYPMSPVAVHDVVDVGYFSFDSHHGITGFVEGGSERGSLVTDAHQAQRYNAGIAYSTKDDLVTFSTERIGSQYLPVDGYVAVGDIGGYSAQASHTWRRASGPVESFQVAGFLDRYAGSDGFGTNVYDTSLGGNIFFRNKISLAYSVGSSFYRVPGDPDLHPANQQGVRIDYALSTPQQSTINYGTGRYGAGRLDTWQEQLGFRVARKATVSLSAVDTDWRGDGGARIVQWLDRASVTFDLGPRASLVAGVRKLIGAAPPFPYPQPYLNATNVSLGFSARRPHDDFYLVYGDASVLSTRPALTFKLVHYFGADKGT